VTRVVLAVMAIVGVMLIMNVTPDTAHDTDIERGLLP